MKIKLLIIIFLFTPLFCQDAYAVSVSSDPHYFSYNGNTVIPLGDSVTQGWMELGSNFNQTAYLDKLASNGVNSVLIWAYMGITDQSGDSRIGYDAPEIWPWQKPNGQFDLRSFNDSYFSRLSSFVDAAHQRHIMVFITIHDGWTKDRFAGHPFNAALGNGTLTDKSQYVNLYSYTSPMPSTYSDSWSSTQKHQYFLERFSQKLIDSVGSKPNIVFELFNEGEWYDQTKLRQFQKYFVDFFNQRTSAPMVINDDHVSGTDFRNESNEGISHHLGWSTSTTADSVYGKYLPYFTGSPAKPFLVTETVPDFRGDSSQLTTLMRLLWGAAMSGTGMVIQNDASFGFDSRTIIAGESVDRDKMIALEGHASRFFHASGISVNSMRPSTGYCSQVCLGKDGEYIIYSQSGSSFTVNLSPGTYTTRFYNPQTGQFNPTSTVSLGNSTVTKPSSGDWVFHAKKSQAAPTPTPTRTPTPTPTIPMTTPTPITSIYVSGYTVADSANVADWKLVKSFTVGTLHYADRLFTLSSVPSELAGNEWLQSANDSKTATANPLVTVTLKTASRVYLVIDSRVSPSWLSNWTKTGLTVTDSQPHTFVVYYQDRPAGTLSVGPQNQMDSSMYSLVFTPPPANTPIPKVGDIDRDGDVDIFDYNLLVSKFGTSDCSVNISNTCTIDIFDYNLLIQNFGN